MFIHKAYRPGRVFSPLVWPNIIVKKGLRKSFNYGYSSISLKKKLLIQLNQQINCTFVFVILFFHYVSNQLNHPFLLLLASYRLEFSTSIFSKYECVTVIFFLCNLVTLPSGLTSIDFLSNLFSPILN